MKLTIDSEDQALYFRLADDKDITESEEIQPGIIIDYDKDGNFIGLEILDINKRFPQEMIKNFQFETI